MFSEVQHPILIFRDKRYECGNCLRRLKLCSALSCHLLLCVKSLSLVLPLAGPGALHPEHQVVLDGAPVSFPHTGSDYLQQWGQTPDLIEDGR